MKKKLFLITGIVLIMIGAAIRIYVSHNAVIKDKAVDKKYEKTSVLFADSKKSLEELLKKNNAKILKDECYENYLIIEGCKFSDYFLNLSAEVGNGDRLDRFEGAMYPFHREEKITAEDVKTKSDKLLKYFFDLLGAGEEKFRIIEKKSGLILNSSSMDSYAVVAKNEAAIQSYIKDQSGYIWALETTFDDPRGLIAFRIVKCMNPEITKNMYYDVDLSQTNSTTKGNQDG